MNPEQKKQFETLREIISARADEYEIAAAAQERVWNNTASGCGSVSVGAAATQERVWTGALNSCPLLLNVELPEHLAGFPRYNPGEIHHDKDKMLLNGMLEMAGAALGGMQSVPSLRANMGCGIFASMFPGVTQRLFYDARMPWVVEHLPKERIAAMGEEDVGVTDEFRLALDHMDYLAEHIDGTGAYVYPLDVQGPFDVAHLVYGDAIFYDLYDDPPFIHHLMNLCIHAIIVGFEECLKRIPRSNERIAHYNSLVMPRSLGGVKLSEDTSTLVGGHHLDEFVVPATARVLERFGGGYIHYCGKHEGLFNRLLQLPLVRGFNFGNPDFHDMDEKLGRIAAAGKAYYGSVPARAGESRCDFFTRVRRAATPEGGVCRLLLQYASPYDERDDVRADWAASS